MDWIELAGWPDYEVCKEGLIRHKESGHVYGQSSTRKTRLMVVLRNGNFSKNCLIHRLVAETFIPHRPYGADVVIWKDGNHLNNHVDNLRWGYRYEIL